MENNGAIWPYAVPMGQQDDSEAVAITMVGEVEYRFATDVSVLRPREMVYLDFIQRDPRSARAVGMAPSCCSSQCRGRSHRAAIRSAGRTQRLGSSAFFP